MTRTYSLLLCFALLSGCANSALAQSYTPKTIQFKGDKEHSPEELMATAGLKKGAALTAALMNDRTKQLLDSGVFENINYTFNGQDLVFQITPSTALYKIQLENFPFEYDKQLEDRLHGQIPLFHGMVPMQGTLLDRVHDALIEELALKGIQAAVSAAPYGDMKPGEIPIMSFNITSPTISVGEIQLDGASAELATKARLLAAKSVGTTYSTAGSQSQLEANLGNFYHEQGFLEATVRVRPLPQAVTDVEGAHIPLAVLVDEGPQYRLGRIELAAEMVVTQAAFDKQSDLHSGEIVSLVKLRADWEYLARQYHNSGYMKASIHPVPAYDRAQRVANYKVSAEPGPVYSMGALKVNNVSADVRTAIAGAWPMASGATFNEGTILGMTATHGVNAALERLFPTVSMRYALRLHDEARTVDVDLTLEKKH